MPLPLVATLLIYVVGFWMLFHSVLGICEASELSGIGVRGWGWLLAWKTWVKDFAHRLVQCTVH